MRKLREILERHQVEHRDGLVRATEGKMRALQDRVAMRRREIEARRAFIAGKEEVCVGLLKVGS
jgi:hypothetical protein